MEGIAQNAGVNSVNDGLALAALVARPTATEGYDTPWKAVVGGGVCDLRESVKDAASEIRSDVQSVKSDIRESIQNHMIQNTTQFAHVHEKACDAEKEAIKAQYEGKIQTIQTGKEVENRISDLERANAERFTEVEKSILREHCETRSVVRDQGERTREQLEECCCAIKERISAIDLRAEERFGRLSEQHLRQTLQETKDELQEARFEAILAKVGGNGKS